MKKAHNLKPIDIVIPWVDGTDPAWLAEKRFWEEKCPESDSTQDKMWFRGDIRYRDWGTLRYLFRGIEQFAPWVQTVWFVTWGHFPDWLNQAHPKLKVIRHEDYIPAEFLPTFNSHTIELNFHRIPGLAEQFVYFNDDMFLTAPARPEDFFRGGLPCDSAILNPIPMRRGVGRAEINNICVLNDHFDKNSVIRRAPFKWFNPRYGTKVFRNCLMMPWTHFVGLYEQHLPTSFLKSTFDTVWAVEEEELRAACSCKFRERSNVNQWLFKNWQLAEGKFVPRSMKIGKYFVYGENNNYEAVCSEIAGGKWKLVCINDNDFDIIDDYERRKEQLIQAFDQILPGKSGFEK